MNKKKRYYGFFALLTNQKMDAITALELYHNKDVIECFEVSGQKIQPGEILQKQYDIYEGLGIASPSSL